MVCVADPMERVLVTEVQGSEDVILARPSNGGEANRFQITKVLKSAADLQSGAEVRASLPLFSTDAGKIGRGTVLLTRRDAKSAWIIRAPANGLHQVAFFQKVLSMPPELDDTPRTAFFARYLHHADPLLAKAAAAEIASAPYASLAVLKEKLEAEKIRAHLQDPAAGDRRALWYTLLGVCGDADDAAAIDKTVDAMWRSKGWKNLAALLTAKLELKGEPAVAEIEERYIRDEGRTLPEIEAAILALRVHGNADGAISRRRAIEAYRCLLDDRERLVFLIAGDLARWEDWESKERLVAIAEEHGDALPEIWREVAKYLALSPQRLTDLAP